MGSGKANAFACEQGLPRDCLRGAHREGLAGGARDHWRRREQLLPSTEQHVLFILGGFLTSQCEYFGRDCLFYIWIGVGTSCCSCVCVHAVVTRRDRLPSTGTGGWSWRNSFPSAAFCESLGVFTRLWLGPQDPGGLGLDANLCSLIVGPWVNGFP